MKNKLNLITAGTVIFACCTPLVQAASKNSPSPAPNVSATASPKAKASPAPKTTSSPAATNTTTDASKARAIPFHGMISAADAKAKTFTIASKEHSRVFKITDKTVLTKAGAPATMKDVVANEEVRGSYWKVTDGTLEAKTVKLGPKTEAEKAAAEKHNSKKSSTTEAEPSASPKP